MGLSNRLAVQTLPSSEESSNTPNIEIALSIFQIRLAGQTRQRINVEEPPVEVLAGVDIAPFRNRRSQLTPESLLSRHGLSLSDLLNARENTGLHLLQHVLQLSDLTLVCRGLLTGDAPHNLDGIAVLLNILLGHQLLCRRSGDLLWSRRKSGQQLL
jgi:hypothetical protein